MLTLTTRHTFALDASFVVGGGGDVVGTGGEGTREDGASLLPCIDTGEDSIACVLLGFPDGDEDVCVEDADDVLFGLHIAIERNRIIRENERRVMM